MLALSGVERNGDEHLRLPNTSNLLFRGVRGEAMLIALDMQGMSVSTGSACSSGSIEPSHVLLAMGRTYEEARYSVRFSFGRYNSADDIRALSEAIRNYLQKMRRASKVERPVYA
jgi:cysteine desulfurase